MTEIEIALSFVAFSFAVVAAPFVDYGDGLLFSNSMCFVPMCVAVFGMLAIASTAAGVSLHRLAVGNVRALRRPLAFAIVMVLCSASVLAIFPFNAQTESSLDASRSYGIALGVFYFVMFMALPLIGMTIVAVGTVPLWALVRVAICLAGRDGRSAALFMLLPTLAVCLFFAGRLIGNRAVIHYVGPILQSAIRDVASGKKLPQPSQAFPIVVARGAPVRAYYVLGGLLMASTYIVYDPADSKSPNAVAHISKLLDGGHCEVGASPIGGGYFLAGDGC